MALRSRQALAQFSRGGQFVAIALLVVGAALVIPYILIAALGGSLVRTAYPAYILVIACLITVKRRPLYPAFILAVFAFSPFLRRIADYQAGFAVFNLILLAPYIGLLPTLPALLRRALGGGKAPLSWPFAMILACVIYGSFLALFRMAFVPAIYEAMRWLLPMALCCFIMERPEVARKTRQAVLMTLGLLLPILTVYGIYQFLYAPLWDVFWLSNIDNPTFGEGEAFKIRVFSMMNSPGSVAVFSALAMILLAGDSLLGIGVAAVALPLLGLTVIRTAWLALGVGLAVLFWKASAMNRLGISFSIVIIASMFMIVLSSHTLPPDIRNLITDRFSTFSDLGTDKSTYDRLRVYHSFFDRLSESPWGEGFGVNESTVTRQASRGPITSIDSGLLEAYMIYGVFIGTLYFVTMIEFVRQAWRALSQLPSQFSGHMAVICAVIAMIPLGSIQTGESGVLLWTAFGLLMAAASSVKSNGPILKPASGNGTQVAILRSQAGKQAAQKGDHY